MPGAAPSTEPAALHTVPALRQLHAGVQAASGVVGARLAAGAAPALQGARAQAAGAAAALLDTRQQAEG